jgi:hypothetical protein
VTEDAVPEEQRLVVGAVESVWFAEVPQDPLVTVVVAAQIVPFQLVPELQIAVTVLESRVRVPDTRVKELVPYASTRGVEDPVSEVENCVVPWRTERVLVLEEVQEIGTVQLDAPPGIAQAVGIVINEPVGDEGEVTFTTRFALPVPLEFTALILIVKVPVAFGLPKIVPKVGLPFNPGPSVQTPLTYPPAP